MEGFGVSFSPRRGAGSPASPPPSFQLGRFWPLSEPPPLFKCSPHLLRGAVIVVTAPGIVQEPVLGLCPVRSRTICGLPRRVGCIYLSVWKSDGSWFNVLGAFIFPGRGYGVAFSHLNSRWCVLLTEKRDSFCMRWEMLPLLSLIHR